MKRKLISAFMFALMFIGMTMSYAEEPIFKFGVMSDLHNQQTLIDPASGDLSDIKLRGTVTSVLDKLKADENLDLLVLNGDYTSDVTISQDKWEKVKELMMSATRGIFATGKATPVIYSAGNHDYEVANFSGLPKDYNAADFYATPMKTDIGALAVTDCFYETAENGTSESKDLLAAYHYVIGGFDFVVLNCGKYFFANAWDYQYSEESVQWVADKLAKIYADNANKTVFFIAHMPFADSKSMSATDKGLKDCTATSLLKSTLAQYPNLIHIYGHDHGSNNAFIRTETAQRVTQYDTNGNVYSTEPAGEATSVLVSIKNSVSGKYLGRLNDANGDNMRTFDEKYTATVAPSATSGMYQITLTTENAQKAVHIGSSGRWSTGDVSDVMLYKVAETNAGVTTATRVTGAVADGDYLIVALKGTDYYAMTNEEYSTGADLRLVGTVVSLSTDLTTASYTDADLVDQNSAIWTLTDESGATAGTPSFISVFDGSMRYYNNFVSSGSTVDDSRIAQALVVSVFADKIELQMKNYAETGDLTGIDGTTTITIADTPTPYVINRTVVGSPATENVTVTLPATVENGTLEVTVDGIALKAGENTVTKGSTLTFVATPADNYILDAIRVNEAALDGTTFVADADAAITVSFITMPDYCTTTENMGGTKNRKMGTLTVAGGVDAFTSSTVQSTTSSPVYVDKTAEEITVYPGSELSITLAYTGQWMHGYAYIDYNGDHTFNTTVNADGTTGGELVSYSYYAEDGDGKASVGSNSLGTVNGSDDGMRGNGPNQMPKFTLPADLPVGKYRFRYKVDWCSLDPCGNSAANNLIAANDGCIVDFTLNVVKAPEMVNVTMPAAVEHGIFTVSTADAALAAGTTTALPLGTELTIVATPDEGYVLDGVYANGSKYESATYTANADVTFNAVFNEKSLLSAVRIPEGSGTSYGYHYRLSMSDQVLGSRSVSDTRSRNITLSTWVNPANTSGEIISDTQEPFYVNSGSFSVNLTNGNLSYKARGYNGGGFSDDVDFTTDVAMPVGEWNFVTVTIDSDNKKVSLYKNGVLVKEATMQYPIGLLGDDCVLTAGSYAFAGDVDEFQVWNRVLTADEVKASMTKAEGEGLVGYYDFSNLASDNTFANLGSGGVYPASLQTFYGYYGATNCQYSTAEPTMVMGRVLPDFAVTYDGGTVEAGGTFVVKNDAGEVVTSGSSVMQGTVLTVEATPAEGYTVKNIIVNDVAIAHTAKTFIVGGATVVAVEFTDQNLLYYGVEGNGGTMTVKSKVGEGEYADIAPESEYADGTSLQFTFAPEQYYELKSFVVNNADVTAQVVNNEYVLDNLDYGVTAVATFGKIQHAVTFSCEGEGALRVTQGQTALTSGDTVDAGSVITITGVPNNDLATLTKFNINGEDKKTEMANGTMTMTVTAPVTIEAAYYIEKFAVTVNITGQGTVEITDDENKTYVSGEKTIVSDTYITLALTPATNWTVASLVVDDADVTSEILKNKFEYGFIGADVVANVTFSMLTGVDGTAADGITVSYNNETLTVAGLNEGESYGIYDVAGKLVMTSDKASENLSGLSAGCYIVKVVSVNGAKTLKFVK